MMARLFCLAYLAACICGNAEAVSYDPTKWKEVVPPAEANGGDYAVWWYSANYSRYEWRVSNRDGVPFVTIKDDSIGLETNSPNFVARVGRFVGGRPFAVNDGWLIGYNQGEFGAALYWFSRDGKDNYKISDHQVVCFFQLSNEVYAIEGLAHMLHSRGSIIHIAKDHDRWQATEAVKLPAAPEAIAIRRDGTMLITLSDSLVSVNSKFEIQTLLEYAQWGSLYPNSSILSPDERNLYIGMRQYVVEFYIDTGKLRYLVPSSDYINKLPPDFERSVRKPYDR
jgi:hypothetical protein